MRIRIEGTHAELANAIRQIRAVLPVGSVSTLLETGRPYTWRVFINTAPDRSTRGRWVT
ncbi:hypothetical protein AB0B45_15065 [Nonomuraea sp. NPDC049152]|uniref:hypothetical protein n=1 Tax=Nonomuraea sp. NPDC049152 TaxID=3154350 RepID=UPI00340EA2DB